MNADDADKRSDETGISTSMVRQWSGLQTITETMMEEVRIGEHSSMTARMGRPNHLKMT